MRARGCCGVIRRARQPRRTKRGALRTLWMAPTAHARGSDVQRRTLRAPARYPHLLPTHCTPAAPTQRAPPSTALLVPVSAPAVSTTSSKRHVQVGARRTLAVGVAPGDGVGAPLSGRAPCAQLHWCHAETWFTQLVQPPPARCRNPSLALACALTAELLHARRVEAYAQRARWTAVRTVTALHRRRGSVHRPPSGPSRAPGPAAGEELTERTLPSPGATTPIAWSTHRGWRCGGLGRSEAAGW